MTEFDFLIALIDKGGLPASILGGVIWAMWRFGLTPSNAAPPSIDTASAIKELSAELKSMHNEVTDRLARVETDIANIYRGHGK